MSAARPTIAVLGTGRMGAPIARNLLAAEFPVSVWNRTAARAEPLAEDGAQLAATPAEAVKDAELVLTMLADGSAVEGAMSGADGASTALRPGSVWIQMATIGIDWTERLAKLAAEHDVEFVDAPVSGSDGPARDGELVVLASGPQELRAILEPVFDAVGRKTLWLGPAGQGMRLKLLLNNWLATQVEAVAETIVLAEALGVHAHVFTDTIADSPLGSPYAVAKGRAMIDGEFEPGFSLRMAFKDIGLALEAARELRTELPITFALEPRWEEAMADHADEDVAVVISAARPEAT
jgi:3-hydroxyisobutyrate dehydrogenase